MTKRITVCLLWIIFAAVPIFGQCRIAQSTSGTIKIGPFIDDTDFKTAKTALTIQKADVRVSKNGGNMAAASADQGASDVGAPHDELGVYDISYNTTDSNTVGNLRFDIKETAALAVWQTCEVYQPSATIPDILNYPKDLVTNVDGLGYWLKTNADAPISQNGITALGIRTTILADTSQTTFTLTEGGADDTAYPPGSMVVIRDQSVSTQIAVGEISTYTGATRTVVLKSDPGFTHAPGDFVTIIPDLALKPATRGRSVVVDAAGLADSTAVKVGPTGAATTQTAGDIIGSIATEAEVGAAVWAHASGVAILSNVTAIKTKTDFLPSVTAGASGGVFIAGVNAATTITGSLTTTFTGNLTGSIGSLGAGSITTSTFATGAINAAALAADAGNEFATALLDLSNGVETSLTVRKYFRAVMAVLNGKASGFNTNTPTFRDYNDTKNRVISTTNATGRTSMTFDLD